MPDQLHIFDFDGTLFRNPHDSPENRRKYEKATGLPWEIDKETSRRLSRKHGKHIGMRRGWYGRKETLEPPLTPSPVPKDLFIREACDAFGESKKNEDALTVLMTGRHAGISAQVLRICGDGKLFKVKNKGVKQGKLFVDNDDPDVVCWFMGQNGPDPESHKPNETLPWKMWIIEQYLRIMDDLKEIHIWEDREEHVKEFRELDELIDPSVTVHHVS